MDLIITSINNPRAYPVLTRNLAGDPSISLEKARTMLQNLPVTYLTDISQTEAEEAIIQLNKLGVTAKIIQPQSSTPLSQGKNVTWKPADTTKEPSKKPTVRKKAAIYRSPAQKVSSIGTRTSPKSTKIRNIASGIAGIAVMALIVGAMIFLSNFGNDSYRETKSGSPAIKKRLSKTRSKAGQQRKSRKKPSKGRPSKQRPTPTSSQKRQAVSYIDSARVTDDNLTAIKFYTIALSFNKYNVDAWYGLINAYSDAGMLEEAREARAEMKAIFGDNVFSLTGIVELYGTPQDISRTPEGTLRIEYQSKNRSKSELTEEAFRLAKALRSECRCTALSFFAQTGKGKGLLVHTPLEQFPPTLAEFKKKASLTFLE
ncbi:MAG: hypothetical protein GF401_11305 [Chitinivibrionales bacterium]|nr:hypothetical protein [Chitinivibrionales bacterium]